MQLNLTNSVLWQRQRQATPSSSRRVPNEGTKSLSECLQNGDVAATIVAGVPFCLGKAPSVPPLFSNLRGTTKQYFQQTGIFPIMHLLMIGVPRNLCGRD